MKIAALKSFTGLGRSPVIALGMATALALAAPVGAAAKNDNANKGGGKANQETAAPETDQTVGDVIAKSIIDSSSRALIEEYFRDHPQPVEALPPGIAKNVARGKPLPPGIAKRSIPDPLQTELRRRDSSVGKIVDALIVGDDVALVDAATGVVVDIIVDIVRAQ